MKSLKLDTMKKCKIVFTGGGTAGHAIPNFLLINELMRRTSDLEVMYIGSYDGIERELFGKEFNHIGSKDIKYEPIKCDKLRRYITWRHLCVPFNLMSGFIKAIALLKRFKPNIVFSKGGFVTVPVVLAAKMLCIKVVVHESDYSIGLANRIAAKFADKICVSFEDTKLKSHKFANKMILMGPLIDFAKLDNSSTNINYNGRKTILIMGGSLGARVINETLYRIYNRLDESYDIIHICGKGNLPDFKVQYNGIDDRYKIFEYVDHNTMLQYIAQADLIISRAGVNSAFEIAHAKKPVLFIPLSRKRSRGDQIENANYFKKYGICEVLEEEELNEDILLTVVSGMIYNLDKYIDACKNFEVKSGVDKCCDLIMEISSEV